MVAVYAIVNGNGRLDVRPDARPARRPRRCSAVFLVIESRSARRWCRSSLFRLRNLATANVVGVLWAAAMFAWFFLSALYLQLVLGYSPLQVGLAFLPGEPDHGRVLAGLSAKLVMRYGIRPPLGGGPRCAAVGLAAVRPRAGRRLVRRRRPAGDDPARRRRGHRVQPGAARRDERRGAGGGGPRLGRRQHVVHDGRRARARGAGEHRGLAHGHAARVRRRRQSRR